MKVRLSDSNQGKIRYTEEVNFIHKDDKCFEFQFIVKYYEEKETPTLDENGIPTGGLLAVAGF